MHAHDRTMLSSLGFSDRDKQNPKHDLACQYLAIPENAERLGAMTFPLVVKHERRRENPSGARPPKWVELYASSINRWAGCLLRAHFEQPLVKGENQYKTTIGFQDLVLTFAYCYTETDRQSRTSENEQWNVLPDIGVDRPEAHGIHANVRVEVKASEARAADVIRQINLYRQYLSPESGYEPSAWVLATCFDVHPADVAQLKNERIRHVRLGAGFDEFCAERERGSAQSPDSEVI